MIIAGLQKTTLVDYPGKIAATIFLRGCNFRCGFCHNPELVIPEQYLPAMPKDEIFRFLEKRLGKIDGVCITGGEPLLWPETADFISHLKALGYAVKLDTNGSFPNRLREVIKNGDVDYIAMDIKSPLHNYAKVINSKLKTQNSKLHTGGDTFASDIKKSIDLIISSGLDYEFRTTVAKPYHKPEDFKEIGKLIEGAKKYYIQNFVPSKHILEHINFEPFDEVELGEAKSNVAQYVKYVGLR